MIGLFSATLYARLGIRDTRGMIGNHDACACILERFCHAFPMQLHSLTPMSFYERDNRLERVVLKGKNMFLNLCPVDHFVTLPRAQFLFVTLCT